MLADCVSLFIFLQNTWSFDFLVFHSNYYNNKKWSIFPHIMQAIFYNVISVLKDVKKKILKKIEHLLN